MTYIILVLFLLLAFNEYNQFKLYKFIIDDLYNSKLSQYYSEIMNAYTHHQPKMISHWMTEMYKLNRKHESIMKHPFKSYFKQEII